MKTLAEKYRPSTFDDFKGSKLVATLLRRIVETEQVPSCMLFTGPRGTGKTSMCRLIAQALNGGTPVDSMSYIEVDAASNSGVDNIRSLQEVVRYAHSDSWRIVVLDEAHGLSSAAFNALLKILEDPPNKTAFILVTTKPESLPDTVKSRAMMFRFANLDVPSIARRLAEVSTAEGLHIKDPRILIRIAEVSEGSLRVALVLLQQLTLLDSPTVDSVNELSGYNVVIKDLLYAMLTGSLPEFEVELSILFSKSYLFEKLVKAFVVELKHFHQTNLISNEQFLTCMDVIWSMRKLQAGDDMLARTQLEAGLFYMFSKSFWDGQENKPLEEVSLISSEDLAAIAS